jgi:phage tail P2-like protein
MTNIYNIKLLDLVPPNFKKDTDIIAASKAIDKEFISLVNSIKNVLTFADIDNVTPEVLDLLAWELHCDFYDNTLPIDVRREIVKNALIWHFTKGTPAAVEELMTTVFGDGQVLEWFEYGGQPYHFKVLTSNTDVTTAKLEEFTKALNSVKRKSTRLEAIEVTATDKMSLNLGMVVQIADYITIRQVV